MTTLSSVALLLALAACNSAAPSPTAPASAPTVAKPAAAVDAMTSVDAPTDEPQHAVSLVTDPRALAAIEAAGGSLAALLGASEARDTAALADASPRYAALVDVIAADLAECAASTPNAGVGVRGNLHRLFDLGWLRSPRSRFELVGVAPRLDRAQLPHDCGDVRLIYRLAYETTVGGERVASRVPMTLSVSLAPRPDDKANGCRADAAAWRAPDVSDPDALGRWLVGGPLGKGALSSQRVALVLANFQLLRTPAASLPSLGGNAEYRLRAFTVDAAGALVPAPLENTPDVARISADPALRAELFAWLEQPATLDQIDRGVHRLPVQLRALQATSYSPYGLDRPANQAFRALLAPRDLASLPLAGRATIATPAALLRRLDEQTCQGCHQVRSIAGFHIVGVDPPEAPAGAALAVAYSPLVASERERRARVIDALATAGSADFARPSMLAIDPPPTGPAKIGDACELGTVVASARGPLFDGLGAKRSIPCAPGLSCTKVRGGFPGGMCQARCAALLDGGTCGVIAEAGFNSCLGSNQPFSKCMKHVRPIGLARCDDAHPCRDDYVCARTPAGEGACLPPYFLFPMRVDGHPQQ